MNRLKSLLQLVLRNWPETALLASALMLAIAHAFETFGQLMPCTLCLKQREVYWAAMAVAAAAIAIRRTPIGVRAAPWLNALLGLIFLYGAGLAAYHAGVEWKWWAGPTTCASGGGAAGSSVDQMKALLEGVNAKGPACDKAAWVFLGLSMAGWNALMSLALAILGALAVRSRLAVMETAR
jgi:disulfide bond formation protein DsbB